MSKGKRAAAKIVGRPPRLPREPASLGVSCASLRTDNLIAEGSSSSHRRRAHQAIDCLPILADGFNRAAVARMFRVGGFLRRDRLVLHHVVVAMV